MNRREMLLKALEGAPAQYARSALRNEDTEGTSAAELETAVLFSRISRLINAKGDTSWLQKRLAAIAYRGGPRYETDEAYLKLQRSEVDLDALTAIIREKQLEVAEGFFAIHSGAYELEFEPMPQLCFTINYGRFDDSYERIESRALPNAIDEMFGHYVYEDAQQTVPADRAKPRSG